MSSEEANPRLILFHCVIFLTSYSFTALAVVLGSLSCRKMKLLLFRGHWMVDQNLTSSFLCS